MRNQRNSGRCLESMSDLVERLRRAADDAEWDGRMITARMLRQLLEYHRQRLLDGETLTPRF